RLPGKPSGSSAFHADIGSYSQTNRLLTALDVVNVEIAAARIGAGDRQTLAVARERNGPVVSRRRQQRLQLAGAIHPLHRFQIVARLSGAVNQCSVGRHVKLAGAVQRGILDALQQRNFGTGQFLTRNVESPYEQCSASQVRKVAARKVASEMGALD